MRKQTFCIGENKSTDQKANQCPCFHYSDSTIPLLVISEISSLCGCTDQFVSDRVGNHENLFSCVVAHLAHAETTNVIFTWYTIKGHNHSKHFILCNQFVHLSIYHPFQDHFAHIEMNQAVGGLTDKYVDPGMYICQFGGFNSPVNFFSRRFLDFNQHYGEFMCASCSRKIHGTPARLEPRKFQFYNNISILNSCCSFFQQMCSVS